MKTLIATCFALILAMASAQVRQVGTTGYLAGKVTAGANSWLSKLACDPKVLVAKTGHELGTTDAEQNQYLDATNMVRQKAAAGNFAIYNGAIHPAAKRMTIVKRDPNIECSAARWAKYIGDLNVMQHSGADYRNPSYVGENIAAMWDSTQYVGKIGQTSVDLWAAEISKLRLSDLTKFTSLYGGDGTATAANQIGHYTALVWQNVTSIGCSYDKTIGGWIYSVCQYGGPTLGKWGIGVATPNVLNFQVFAFDSGKNIPDSTWACCSSTTCDATPTYTKRGGVTSTGVALPNLCVPL